MTATPPSEIYQRVGEVFLARRKAERLSQEALAERAGVDPKHYGHIERGRRQPRLETLERIADALGLPLWEVIREATTTLPVR